MLDGVFLLILFALTCAGFAALALTVERHWADLVDRRIPASPWTVGALRLSALICGGAGLAVAVLRDGWSFGILLWVMMLTAGALAVSAAVTWATRRATRRTIRARRPG